jgi:hypothetical protein
MTVGQVPVAAAPEIVQLPDRHWMLPVLHVWPAPTHVTAVHWWLEKSHPSPDAHSAVLMQGPPTAPAGWHVEVPFTAGQTSGPAHCPSSWQGVPAPPSAAHTPVVLHCSPEPQRSSS